MTESLSLSYCRITIQIGQASLRKNTDAKNSIPAELVQPKLLEAANIENVKAKQAQACFSDLEEDARSAGVMFEQKMLISRKISETISAEIEV